MSMCYCTLYYQSSLSENSGADLQELEGRDIHNTSSIPFHPYFISMVIFTISMKIILINIPQYFLIIVSFNYLLRSETFILLYFIFSLPPNF